MSVPVQIIDIIVDEIGRVNSSSLVFGYEGENKIRQVNLTYPDLGADIKAELRYTVGGTVSTLPLMSNSFLVPATMLRGEGGINAQLVVKKEGQVVFKSEMFTYTVGNSMDASDSPADIDVNVLQDDISAIDERVKILEEDEISEVKRVNGQFPNITGNVQIVASDIYMEVEPDVPISIEDEVFVLMADNQEVRTIAEEAQYQASQNAFELSELGIAKANRTELPTQVSQLSNDAGYVNSTQLVAGVAEAKDYTDVQNTFDIKDVQYTPSSGVWVFTRHDDTTVTVDIPIENIVKSGYYDEATQELVLVLDNDQEIRIPASGLIEDYTGVDTLTIQCIISPDNMISCNVKGGSISKILLTTELQEEINSKEANPKIAPYSVAVNPTDVEATATAGVKYGAGTLPNALVMRTLTGNIITPKAVLVNEAVNLEQTRTIDYLPTKYKKIIPVDGYIYLLPAGRKTGALQITIPLLQPGEIPKSKVEAVVELFVNGINLDENFIWSFRTVSHYYEPGNTWINSLAITDSAKISKIRYGYDTVKDRFCVVINDLTSTWEGFSANISKAIVSYGDNVESYPKDGTGWKMELITTDSHITYTGGDAILTLK